MEKRKRLTWKQLNFAKGKIMGLTTTEAARQAGYSCPQVMGSRVLEKVRNHPDFLAMMDKAGLSERKLFAPIKEALTATKTANYEGEVIGSDEPDHAERLKAAEIAFRLRGQLKNKDDGAQQNNMQVNINRYNDAKTEEIMKVINDELRGIESSKF